MHNVLDLKYCAHRTRIDLPLVRMKSQSCKDWGGVGGMVMLEKIVPGSIVRFLA